MARTMEYKAMERDIRYHVKPGVFTHPEMVSTLVSGNTKFAVDMYRELCKEECANIIFSPVSVSMALGMTYLGALTDTACEMKQALGWSELLDKDIHEAFKDLNRVLHSDDDDRAYVLKTANRIYARMDRCILAEFAQASKEYYGAETQCLDFEGNGADQSRAIINSWVEERTVNKIKDLMPEGSINGDLAMVLVSAIYFKGAWQEKFSESETRDAKFKLHSGGTADVQMMFLIEEMPYKKNVELDCEVVQIPYTDRELSMFVILPQEKNGLAELERKITAETLMELTSNMQQTEVRLDLPRFKLEYSFSAKDILHTLGMKGMFRAGIADFSKMDGTKTMTVSDVVHKAFIEVNEEGTEAVAVTCMVETDGGSGAGGGGPSVYFNADHPFLFCVRENHSGSILFLGRLSHPSC